MNYRGHRSWMGRPGYDPQSGLTIDPLIYLNIIIERYGYTSIRIDGCAYHLNNIPDLIIEKPKIIQ